MIIFIVLANVDPNAYPTVVYSVVCIKYINALNTLRLRIFRLWLVVIKTLVIKLFGILHPTSNSATDFSIVACKHISKFRCISLTIRIVVVGV